MKRPVMTDAPSGAHSQGEAIETIRRLLNSVPFLKSEGRHIDVEVGAGSSAAVNHGLGRRPTGWIPLDWTGDPLVVRSDWTNETVTFTNSGASTANLDVWIY